MALDGDRAFATPSELEVPATRCSPGPTLGTRSRQQAHNSSQVLPGRLVQRRIGADQIADHIPCRYVERTFRWRPHSQRDRALWTETDPLGRRFLPRAYAHGLREHIHSHRFVSRLEFPITAKTIKILQRSLPRQCGCGPCPSFPGQNTVFSSGGPQVCRKIPATWD